VIKRIAAISVLAGAVLAGGGGIAFADPPSTDPGNGNRATVTRNDNSMCAHSQGATEHGRMQVVQTPSGNFNVTCHVH